MNIGFIGVGRMGEPMAANLIAAGWEVSFFDPFATGEKLVASGALRVERVEALADAPVTVSMLPDGPSSFHALEALAAGNPSRGNLHIVMGTVGYAYARRLDEFARARGLRYADAPVSGSVASAAGAQLTAFLGCDADDVAEVSLVVSGMTSKCVHVGGAGAGSTVKLAVNTLIATQNQAIGEAVNLVRASGVDPARAYEAFLGSAAASPYMAYKEAAFLTPFETPVAAPIAVIRKDLQLALELAEGEHCAMPLTEAAAHAIDLAVQVDGADVDMSRVALRI